MMAFCVLLLLVSRGGASQDQLRENMYGVLGAFSAFRLPVVFACAPGW